MPLCGGAAHLPLSQGSCQTTGPVPARCGRSAMRRTGAR